MMAWGSREGAAEMGLLLKPAQLGTVSADSLIQMLLTHVHHAAKGMTVPMLVPRVEIVPIPDAAGLFEISDGWVTIRVDPLFWQNMPQAKAILCHEVCHYILSANGVRREPVRANEQLTDVAMFVFGLGDVFLAGYRSSAGREYRSGHRLGYLSDDQYAFLDQYVRQLRKSGQGLRSRTEVSAARLAGMIPDNYVRARLLSHARSRFPHLDESAVVQRVAEEYVRDRR